MAKTVPEQLVSYEIGIFLVRPFLEGHAEKLLKGKELWGKVSEGDQEVKHTRKVKEGIYLLDWGLTDEITIASCLRPSLGPLPFQLSHICPLSKRFRSF